jgi:hypothetical protein
MQESIAFSRRLAGPTQAAIRSPTRSGFRATPAAMAGVQRIVECIQQKL